MAMTCISGSCECDGCMECQDEEEYICPKCGKEVFDTIYISDDGSIVGCENCIITKEPYEVMGE